MLFDISTPLGGAPASQDSKDVMEVEMTTIDSACRSLKLKGPFLLKLDTHGIEKSILQGAEQTLSKCAVLIIEAYNYEIREEALLFWELCAFLAEKGFRPIDLVDVMHRKHDHSLWQMDLFFIRSDWEGFNCITYL
ncbi:MAG: FkbM family methyltransferase [Candidatus Electrothrix sp. ATG1]|nr:FkbM family methyltransferase [Candidatus Electrothrix sp. ATG1]